MHRPWALALAPVLFALPAAAQPREQAGSIAEHYIRRAWGTADGLPQNSVTAITQTRDGYLWLGTFGGLVRFDGNAFTVFDSGNTPGLASARIITLREDRRGVLWIGTEAGLTKYEGRRFTTYTMRDGLPSDEVAGLFDDSRGRLWIETTGGLARHDGRSFARIPLADLGVPGPIVETPDGDVWVGAINGLARFHADEPPVVVDREPFGQLFVDSRGRLWLGSNRLRRLDAPASPGSGFADVPLLDFRATTGPVISAITEDRDGAVWIATSERGVYRWRDDASGAQLVVPRPANDAFRALHADREGNLWIGYDVGGLNRYKPRRVFSYAREGTSGQSIAPIVDDGAGGLWVGATCGGLFHFRDGRFQSVDPALLCIWALLRDADGTLWVGSMGDGLGRLSGGRYVPFKRSDSDRNNLVTALARDRNGALWVGSDAGLSRFDNGGFIDVGRDQGIDRRVLTITPDRAGALWIGTISGLYRLVDGRVTRYGKAEGLSHEHVRAIHEDADGVLWIGTYGGGLNRYKDGRFVSYGIKEGLPDVAVSRIIEDPRGNFWMSGNKGVYRVARSQLNDFAEGRIAYLTSVTYGTADGMVVEETNGGSPAGWRTKDGRLWFPTIKGLVAIEPEAEAHGPPPVFVEGVIVGGRSLNASALSSLGPGGTDAEFHYTAVDLAAAEKTRFRYRLSNYDADWIDSGSRRVAYYTKVPPGHYTFEVMATDSDGKWSAAPARIAMTVVPFWWQRREAIAAGLLLLVAVTGFSVRHVVLRRARARVAELEREHALERERSRIARDLHDDLGSRLTHIAMLADAPANGNGRIAQALRDAVRTMDELVWAVNARNDTVEGFAFYLAQFAEEHIIASGARCRIILPPDLPARPLGADARRHLYLACKEAVNNAIKHARASEIRVALRIEGDHLIVEVGDDGRGLPAELDPTGNGLKNYRERMEAAGGTVGVETSPGHGTRITFSAPL